MTNFKIIYNHPWLLLLVIPAVMLALIPHFLTERKYRRTRNRIISLVAFLVASIFAINLLAGISFTYENPNENNELIILVDVSESGETERRQKDELLESIVSISNGDFNVGIVKFGYDQVYAAEMSSNIDKVISDYYASAEPDTTASDIASALEYAAGLLSYPKSAKIVLLSDGIETDGQALSVIKAIAARGVKLDTVHFSSREVPEVQILSVDIPEQYLMIDEPFSVELNIKTNIAIEGELLVDLEFTDNGNKVGETQLTVTEKEMTVPIEITLDQRGFHELAFKISHSKDTSEKNNTYHTYVSIQQFNKILLIEKYPGESSKMQEIFGDNYEVTTINVEEAQSDIPRTIEELAEYEQVILVNIAYSDMPAGFEELLHRYVYNLGGGLFTVGGINDGTVTNPVPHAYNREDLEKSTYYKQMLPVSAIDFTPPTAVMIVVDSSGSMTTDAMEGKTKYDLALDGATACLDTLGDRDYCGIVSFQSTASEKMQLIPVAQKDRIVEIIEDMRINMDAGDTIFSGAIIRAGEALAVLDNVEKKHIVMITDGMPSDKLDVYGEYIKDNLEKGITMSIITVGSSSDNYQNSMKEAAEMGGGQHYHVTDPKTIPTKMQTVLSLEAIPEIAYGESFNLTIKDKTTVVTGIDDALLPTLSGYYGTVKKADAVVPLMGKYVPIYAQWKYGSGNVGSFMCDLNGTWSEEFINDIVGQSIILNIVDNIFPNHDVRADGINFVIKTDNYKTQLNVHGVPEDHRIEVEVKPISNSLADLMEKGIPVTEAEGNRRFIFNLRDAGLYEILVKRYDEQEALLSEIVIYKSFSYSEEYNYFPERTPIGDELLSELAKTGNGIVVDDVAEIFNTFNKTVKRAYDPRIVMLIVIILAVLIDIAVRKFKFKWIHEIINERKFKKAEEAKKKG